MSASDDGLPNDTLTYTWSKVSGAGTLKVATQSADLVNHFLAQEKVNY